MLARLERAGAREPLYPLELAALATASLRSLDVPALVAEVYRYANEKRPLEPSGHLGYYAVFVPGPNATGVVYDVYAGRTEAPAAGDYAPLDDAQAIGAALIIRSSAPTTRCATPPMPSRPAAMPMLRSRCCPSLRLRTACARPCCCRIMRAAKRARPS